MGDTRQLNRKLDGERSAGRRWAALAHLAATLLLFAICCPSAGTLTFRCQGPWKPPQPRPAWPSATCRRGCSAGSSRWPAARKRSGELLAALIAQSQATHTLLRSPPPPLPPPPLDTNVRSCNPASDSCSPTVTLVSHAWRDALYSEPGFWSRLRMVAPAAQPDRPSEQHTARLAAQLSLGCRVAPLVTALHIRDVDSLQWAALSGPGIGSAERLFGLLRPDRLVDLDLSGWTAMPPSLLSRFPNLHSLSLSSCKCNGQPHWPPAMLHSVCSMRQLKVLAISGSHFPPQLLSAVAEGLPQLYALMVTSRQGLQHADQLTHITGLRYLMLIEYPRVESCLQPPAPAQLPSLQSYYLRAAHAGMQVGTANSWRRRGRGPSASVLQCCLESRCIA